MKRGVPAFSRANKEGKKMFQKILWALTPEHVKQQRLQHAMAMLNIVEAERSIIARSEQKKAAA